MSLSHCNRLRALTWHQADDLLRAGTNASAAPDANPAGFPCLEQSCEPLGLIRQFSLTLKSLSEPKSLAITECPRSETPDNPQGNVGRHLPRKQQRSHGNVTCEGESTTALRPQLHAAVLSPRLPNCHSTLLRSQGKGAPQQRSVSPRSQKKERGKARDRMMSASRILFFSYSSKLSVLANMTVS